jgi:hypothetical protein
MSVQEDVYSRLSTYADLIAVVGTSIYPHTVPQPIDLPALVYFVVSDVPEYAMMMDADFKTIRLQISCLAESYSKTKEMETQVKAALNRYRVGNIKDCFLESTIDLEEELEFGFHTAIDFIIYYSEA